LGLQAPEPLARLYSRDYYRFVSDTHPSREPTGARAEADEIRVIVFGQSYLDSDGARCRFRNCRSNQMEMVARRFLITLYGLLSLVRERSR
jgi:hypothetical protein